MLRIISKSFLLLALCCFITGVVFASEEHHHYHASTAAIEKAYNQALPAAAGQHHYKATTQLQWSVGAAFTDDDDGAVSFGLGLQLGEVFTTGSFSTDGEESIAAVAGSGTF